METKFSLGFGEQLGEGPKTKKDFVLELRTAATTVERRPAQTKPGGWRATGHQLLLAQAFLRHRNSPSLGTLPAKSVRAQGCWCWGIRETHFALQV